MRYPDYNTDKENYFKFRPFFSHIPPNSVGVEVGTFEGYNALGICNFCSPTKLYCVDPYKTYDCVIGDYMGRFTQEQWNDIYKRTQLKLDGKPVEFVRVGSIEGSKLVPNELDYVYLDGDHSTKALLRDLETWYSKVKSGGLLGGHDANEPEVKQGLIEWLFSSPDGNKYTSQVQYGWSDWWICK